MSSNKLNNHIQIRGAKENNLKNIDVDIPRNAITVVAGLSGCGKSSLVFDTLYAEGQRRFLDSLSVYSRHFIGSAKKPEVDSIQGLTPSLSVDQRTTSYSPRSTVGTVSETLDYLRLLFARKATPLCPKHGIKVQSHTPEVLWSRLLEQFKNKKARILAPVAQSKKGEFQKEIDYWEKKSFIKAYIDGELKDLADVIKLEKNKAHDIFLVVDQVQILESAKVRIIKSLKKSFEVTHGLVAIEVLGEEIEVFSLSSSCPECGYSFPDLEPNHFSFNNPRGSCAACGGLGAKTIEAQDEDEDDKVVVCKKCKGQRLNERSLNVFFENKNIADLADDSIETLYSWSEQMLAHLNYQDDITQPILKELNLRLGYLLRIGVGYLSLSRPSRSLSGGESQRIRLASQLGASLVGVSYILDEPSIGLHPKDHHKLLSVLKEIKDRGNTLVIVEHDLETMKIADQLIDIGPGAGVHGGKIEAEGSYSKFIKQNSLTGQYLSGKKSVIKPRSKLESTKFIYIEKACGHNLKEISVEIPQNALVGVAGVSGSGKSTLIMDTLYKHGAQVLNKNTSVETLGFESIKGLEHFKNIIQMTQKPIGKTPRSIPISYIGAWTHIRNLFGNLPESQIRGLTPKDFSFNSKGGRCENCQGMGEQKLDMHFMQEVRIPCDSCYGRRFQPQVLSIKFKNHSISDVLNMNVKEAVQFFENHSLISNKLEFLNRVGLGYLKLGQSSVTLSGGEAQRVKLGRELSKKSRGSALYILDEPTTGLHFQDISMLIDLLHELVDKGHTVIVIEHNIDFLASCDHLIELGPEGGERGGQLLNVGHPSDFKSFKGSPTGAFLDVF